MQKQKPHKWPLFKDGTIPQNKVRIHKYNTFHQKRIHQKIAGVTELNDLPYLMNNQFIF